MAPGGGLLSGANVTITNRTTLAAAAIYAAEFGAAVLPQPLATDSRGRVSGWLDRGPYTATFTYTGLSSWSEDFDSAPAADNSLDSAWLPDNVIVARHLPDNVLAARHIPAGLITLAKLAAEVLPAGLLVPWGGAAAPLGWLLCDGTLVSRTTYATLFALVGHAFNAGVDPGGGNFKLPDLRGRTVHGADSFGAGAANRLPNLAAAAKIIGGTGGEDFHTLTVGEMPSHTHTLKMTQNLDAAYNGNSPARGTTNNSGLVNTSDQQGLTGGGASHNVMQPFQMASWIVKS